MTEPVLSKRAFVPRYARGEFGNASPTWTNLEPFRRDADPRGIYHLRNGVVAGGATFYRIGFDEVIRRWGTTSRMEDWYASEQVLSEVEETLVLQGEVKRAGLDPGRCGLELFSSSAPGVMRDSLRAGGRFTSGLLADSLLRGALCANSYEWLNELLDRYPGHVVEFSAFRRRWGTLWPKFNTIFWEVRMY